MIMFSPVSRQLVICDGRVVIMKCQSQSLLVRSHISPLLSPDLLIRAGLELNHTSLLSHLVKNVPDDLVFLITYKYRNTQSARQMILRSRAWAVINV